MPEFQDRGPFSRSVHRRRLLTYSAIAGLAAAGVLAPLGAFAASVDLSNWTPEYIASIAGTEEVDTAGECSKVVPLDYSGRLTYVGSPGTELEFAL